MRKFRGLNKIGQGVIPSSIWREGLINCFSSPLNVWCYMLLKDFWNPVSCMKGSEAKEIKLMREKPVFSD